MPLSDIAPSRLTYDELTAKVEDLGEPFTSIAQCQEFLRYAQALFQRQPLESDQDGHRMQMRELQYLIDNARKSLGVLRLQGERPVSIVPTDDLQ